MKCYNKSNSFQYIWNRKLTERTTWNITNLKFRLHHKKWQIRTVHKQSLSLSLLTQYCTATAKHFKLTEILKSAC